MSGSVSRLSARGVVKSYHKGLPVLGPCNLDILAGEIVGIVGPSGMGKSTLLQILAGLITPDQGHVELDGQPLLKPSAKTAVVFQEYGLLPWRTVIRNVAFPLEVMRIPRPERLERCRAVLAKVGLADAAGKFPHQLSGGMRQRTALARAIVADPSVLLLDEPMSALDIATKRTMQQQLSNLIRDLRLTTVLVTHDLMDAVRLCDRVLVMAGQPGQLVAEHVIDRDQPEQDTAKQLAALVEAAADDKTWHSSLADEQEQSWVLR